MMIKRQYDYYGTPNQGSSYFVKFVNQVDGFGPYKAANSLSEALKPWKATLGKSKARYRYNVKFHDPKLYSLFVLRWS